MTRRVEDGGGQKRASREWGETVILTPEWGYNKTLGS